MGQCRLFGVVLIHHVEKIALHLWLAIIYLILIVVSSGQGIKLTNAVSEATMIGTKDHSAKGFSHLHLGAESSMYSCNLHTYDNGYFPLF